MSLLNFDPNGPSLVNSGIFGLPYSVNNSKLLILPIPWDATTSYINGTSSSSERILSASKQIDLYDEEFPDNPWQQGIYLIESNQDINQKNKKTRILVENYRTNHQKIDLEAINFASKQLNDYVFYKTKELFTRGYKVILLGGEHSISFGYYQALAEKYSEFGILHIDAHLDLREAYEGFTYSHASIMYNSIKQIPQIRKIISVGIRDYCLEEANFVNQHRDKIVLFSERELQYACMRGTSWHELSELIIAQLPRNIIISLDIDGLDPGLCPNTGTPVMGGRSIYELYYLLCLLRKRNINIIGVDLVEIGSGSEWDANVAARLLYKLSQYILSN